MSGVASRLRGDDRRWALTPPVPRDPRPPLIPQAFYQQSLAQAQSARIEKQRKQDDLRAGLQQCVPSRFSSARRFDPLELREAWRGGTNADDTSRRVSLRVAALSASRDVRLTSVTHDGSNGGAPVLTNTRARPLFPKSSAARGPGCVPLERGAFAEKTDAARREREARERAAEQAQMEAMVRAQREATLRARVAAEEEALVDAVESKKRETTRRELHHRQVAESSAELRALKEKLRAAEVNFERRLQREERAMLDARARRTSQATVASARGGSPSA